MTAKIHWLVAALFTLFVTWVLVTPMIGSGVLNNRGDLLFDPGPTYYDAGVHLSLISEMQHRFPPTNFALGGIPLKNYHYIYDAVLAAVAKVSSLSILDLYYRIGPVAISLLLCLAVYLTTWRLTKNRWAAATAIFFAVMGTSLGSVASYLKFILPGHPNSAGSGLFMTDQIYDWMVNPQGVLALAIFLFLFLQLSFFQTTKKVRHLVVFALLLGTSFGVKAYGGVVFAAGAIVAGAWYLLQKNFRPIVAIAAGLGLLGLWFVTMTDNTKVGLQFAPLWFLDRMMSDYEHLYQADFPVLVNLYLFVGNWWHPLFLYVKAFLIYLVGSLGLRIIGLIPVIWAAKNIRGIFKISPANMFLVGTSLVSFLIPLFFNQSSKPYDIVQFLPYFTLMMGISFTIVLFRLVSRLPKMVGLFVVLLAMAGFLLLDRRELMVRLSPPVASSKIILSADLLAATNFLDANTPVESVVLLAPTERNLGYLWFTSIADRRTVSSGEFFSKQVGADYQTIEDKVKKVFSGSKADINFDYLFLQADEKSFLEPLTKNYRLQEVFANDAAIIFKLVP